MSLKQLRRMDAGEALRLVMCAFTAAFLIAALLSPDRTEMLPGLGRILTQPAQLTRDYFKPELGSVSGAMLNAFLVGAVCCGLTFLPGAAMNGAVVLGYFLTVGFAFYGIHPLNMLPPMLGVALYAALRREPFSRCIHFAMFSTGLAPLISEALFRYPGSVELHGVTLPGVVLALGIGAVVGCAMPALCAHSQSFHKGYNLYNAGPAAGFLCFAIYALLYRTLGIEAPAITVVLGEGHRAFANAFCVICFGLCVALGFVLNSMSFQGYGELLKESGYRTDFTAKYAPGLCVTHVGVYGLFILLYYDLIGATFTGPTLGAVFCMLCCCMSGATPLNVLPIMAGYFLASRFGAFPLQGQGMVVGLCYASGLAPICGEYGILAGVAAGMLHYCMVTGVPLIHGGFNLYNGGFTAGIVCFVCVPLLERFFRRRGEKRR